MIWLRLQPLFIEENPFINHMKSYRTFSVYIFIMLATAAVPVRATSIHASLNLRIYRVNDFYKDNGMVSKGIGIHLTMRDILNTGMNFYVRFRKGKNRIIFRFHHQNYTVYR